MLKLLKSLFQSKKSFTPMEDIELPNMIDEDPWIKIEDQKPPHEVVLAACDTYGCGWTIDSVWWYEEKQWWMTTETIKSKKAHLPSPPKINI